MKLTHLLPCATLALLPLAHAGLPSTQPSPEGLGWPTVTDTTRPWTRWWWLGSAVDEPNLSRMLTQFHDAGIGGVEICPIYGAKGYESRFIPYLSPKWMEMLAFTTRTAARLDLGVDLTTGTGWPMGGPWIPKNQASESVRIIIPNTPGAQPRLVVKQGIQQVKRAAPGGQGYVIDPYSISSLDTYLARFNQAFSTYDGLAPRAEFHDSFEYFGADWTPDLLAEFARRRGYDLSHHLADLDGRGDPAIAARVREDYRRTLAELHLAWVAHWTAWSHGHGSLTREQAHGAPANIEDVYAAADIPETEGSFGGGSSAQIPMMKFASSAAHVTGKRLASSETFTWLGEHFQVPLSSLKPIVDTFFLAGINHMFFHGIPYSPSDAPWPGWLFYAAVNFGPNGGIWHDLPAFNAYATRCQSILQGGQPDNDVLLYFPVADFWQHIGPPPGVPKGAPGADRDPLVIQFTTPGLWMHGSPFYRTAMALWNQGWSYDEVTDDLLAGAKVADGVCVLGGNRYRAIVVPPCRFMPVSTMQKLVDLARAGATVVFEDAPPSDVPGYHDFQARRARMRELVGSLDLHSGRTAVGSGAVYTGASADRLLSEAAIPPESMIADNLHCVRRARPDGTDYFIVNTGKVQVDGWVRLSRPAAYAFLLDPLAADHQGRAALRGPTDAPEVYLQLAPAQSIIVRLYGPSAAERFSATRPWTYLHAESAAPTVLNGDWSVHFLEGGPVLPPDFRSSSLEPWTGRGNADADRFAGTARYTLTFNADPSKAPDWILSLGRVAESARVRLNDRDLGTLWCPPFEIPVGSALHKGRNVLEVDVTNVAANRVRDLDRRHVQWKRFYEINFVNRDYKPFDASGWPVRTSGLVGPVTLRPAQPLVPAAP